MASLQGGMAAASGKTGSVRDVSRAAGPDIPADASCLPPPSRTSKWTHRRAALIVAALSFVTPLGAGGQSAEVPNSAYFGGGGVVVQGNLKLSFTLGEPAAGPVTNGATHVIAGFQATFLPEIDDGGRCTIFCDGFE